MAHNLSDYLYKDETICVEDLLQGLSWDAARQGRVNRRAADLVTRVRAAKRKTGELESFLQQYGLDTEEGIALMTLAEALLRIPDAATADALIRDKIVAADWLSKQGDSKDLLVKAAGFGLSLTRKTLDSALSKIGEPLIRKAIVEAIRMLGRQFVLGRTIEESLKNSKDYNKKGYALSYDMLGEGARTAIQAQTYFDAYSHALTAIGNHNDGKNRAGLSVKLSALYPRYEARHAEDCIPALTEKLGQLAQIAAAKDMALTVDAEEVDRLEISLRIIEGVMAEPSLAGWEGFGLAVQAYQKRCLPLIDYLGDFARAHKRRLQVRLVKGAYWDTEVKRAQIMGLSDYPVFTRKVNTDLSFMACAEKLLAQRDVFYPMLATHNAHTVAAILDMAGATSGFEFQRLHGMGETLYDIVLEDKIAPVRVYAPCGTHEDLLPYLVRRLLENGANSSFVNKLMDPSIPVSTIIADPVEAARAHSFKRHPYIPMPAALYGEGRKNSAGFDLTERTVLHPLMAQVKACENTPYTAVPFINGSTQIQGAARLITNPATGQQVGTAIDATPTDIEKAFASARDGYRIWGNLDTAIRANILERTADLMEEDHATLLHLCIREAGKTWDDAVAELREAVDFCRYYARRGRIDFVDGGTRLPGPTGESNILTWHGRGVFVCISPWNFPLAIFTGQVAAALMAGNAVIAKAAEQTPLVAQRVAELMLKAGVTAQALALLPGDGTVGAQIVAHKDVAGVAFTGSIEAARAINRTLAAKDGAIVPFIAETGGQNAMIVDSSCLPEQVVDDVMASAFGSTGQRCSALRVLYVQEDIADNVITLLKGAMALRKVGDPALYSTDIGPVIDAEARARLEEHESWLKANARFIAAVPIDNNTHQAGIFFAPIAYEIDGISQLPREVFGPVLHVVRYKAADLDKVIEDINNTGFGLTFGLHSRIGTRIEEITQRAAVGNAYVNRTMIGAVVGVQPFGGHGLSGTGPKAGGPHYLHRFATEKVVSVDTTRQGGNTSLVSLQED